MSFRKIIHDVEEKGLSPNVPHTALGSDGRLLPSVSELSKIETTVVFEEIQTAVPKNDIVINPTMKRQEVTVEEAEKVKETSTSKIISHKKKNALISLSTGSDNEAEKSTITKDVGETKTNIDNDDSSTPKRKINANSKKIVKKKTKGRKSPST
jgi:hypothetical protein